MATTSTDPSPISNVRPIPKRELLDYRAEVKGELFRQIRRRFTELKEKFGFTQSHLAKRLALDEGLLSRRIRGENDMRLETLSDLARGLECRIDVRLTPLEEVEQRLARREKLLHEAMQPSASTTPVADIQAALKPRGSGDDNAAVDALMRELGQRTFGEGVVDAGKHTPRLTAALGAA